MQRGGRVIGSVHRQRFHLLDGTRPGGTQFFNSHSAAGWSPRALGAREADVTSERHLVEHTHSHRCPRAREALGNYGLVMGDEGNGCSPS